VRVSRLKMVGISETKNHTESCNFGKCLILDDDFQELCIQRKIFSQRMLNDIK